MSLLQETGGAAARDGVRRFERDGVVIELWPCDSAIVVDGAEIVLPRQSFRVVHCLLLHWEHFVSAERQVVWPDADREPDYTKSGLAILIMKARRKLAPHPLRIENRWGVGWRLHVHHEAAR